MIAEWPRYITIFNSEALESKVRAWSDRDIEHTKRDCFIVVSVDVYSSLASTARRCRNESNSFGRPV